MADQEKTITKNRRGRPATGLGTLVGVRLQPDMLDWLDAKRAALDPELTRPQMMRRVLEDVMKAEGPNSTTKTISTGQPAEAVDPKKG